MTEVKSLQDIQNYVSQLQKQLEQATKAKDELMKIAAERQQQLEQAIKAKNEQAKLVAEHADALSVEKAEIQEVKRSERLTQKMLVKSQVDLDDLREKYAAKVDQEEELVTLVQELRDKLTLASKYYFKLQQAHPEVLSNTSLVQPEHER